MFLPLEEDCSGYNDYDSHDEAILSNVHRRNETWSESSLMNPEEMGSYAEGDILIPPQISWRNGLRTPSMLWSNGQIPFVIEGRFSYEQRDLIMGAIADYHQVTCLRFVPFSGQADYIAITSDEIGCFTTAVGHIGGRQEVNLETPFCVYKKGTVLHELLHVIGVIHEHNRPERDNFITLYCENIISEDKYNFKKENPAYISDYGVSYDYHSVMHYSKYAFTKNKLKTIEPKIAGEDIGQREGLSRGDVTKINNMYNCKIEVPQTGWVKDIYENK